MSKSSPDRDVFIFLLGFIAYPGLFVPLMIHLFPNALEVWIHVYAEYLRMWGI